jgi:hypothetical protein
LWLFGLTGSLNAQATTTTALTVTNNGGTTVTSVSSGTVVELTASVTVSGSNVTLGTVNFCDAEATYCEDEHLFGTAQLTSHGTAVFKFKPAPGVHSYVAKYLGTTAYRSSSSAAESLTVTATSITTSTSIAQSGSAGNYTLTSTVTSSGNSILSPSGTLDYLDTSNSNYVLASATLTPGPATSSYAPFVGYSPGGNLGVIVADFNQDGIPDMLVWGEGSNIEGGDYDIAVLLGKGDGTFQNPMGYNFGSNAGAPIAVAVGDVNGDGYPDVIVSDPSTNELYVLLNNGNSGGGLDWVRTYGFPGYSYNGLPYPVGPVTGIAIGDVNGDGKPDLAITLATFGSPTIPFPNSYAGASEFGIMLGNGDGTFQTGSSYPWTSSAYQSGFAAEVVDYVEPIELVDTRQNGLLDAVVTDENASGACVSLNKGDGTFAAPICYSAPAGESVAVGDLNGDGYPDLVVSSFYSANGPTAILLGSSTGTFQIASSGLPASVTSVALADLNGDGKLDVVLGNNGVADDSPGTIAVAYGNGDGTFGTPANLNATVDGDSVGYVAVGDLNGDGVPDILAVDPPATVNVMLGSVTTSATATATGISPVGPVTNADMVVAEYSGDDYFSTSASASTSLTPQPVPTTLTLQTSASTVTVGSQVTLTATISPGSAQGYSPSTPVVFYMNGNSIGSVTPSHGVAVLTPRLSVVQTASFTASFAGDSNFISSNTTTARSVVVQQAATTLTLQVCNYVGTWICPATTSNYGGEIEITAQLAPYTVTGGTSSDGESVTFYNGTQILGTSSLSGGFATLDLDQPAAGVYSITASYGGDANFIASNSSAASMTVQKITPTVTLSVNPASPNPYGAPVYLSATFQTYPYLPNNTESATFYNGATIVGTAQFIGGTANLTLHNLPVGSYNFTATYAGDSNYNSTYTSPSSFIVQKAQTTLMIGTGGLASGPYGNPLTLYATLSWPSSPGENTPNGDQITFYQNGSIIGFGTLVNGTAQYTVNVPPAGTDSYSAVFGGDPSFASSNASSPAFYQATQLQTSLGLTTSATNGIIATGQPLTLTATLSPYAVAGGTGTNGDLVTFYQNSVNIGTGTLTNGVATLVVNGLAQGNYTFGAIYGGDPAFSGSSSSVHPNVTVLQAASLTLTTNPVNYATPNQSVSIIATLSPYTVNGHSTNGESIYFKFNGNDLGSATLNNGVATLTEPNGLITPGTYEFTAQFLSDGVLAPSNSNVVQFLVATTENFVVNTNGDDSGSASNCTPQDSTISNGTDSSCSLRDALLAAAAAPEGANITFDQNVFTLPNYTDDPALNTITLANGTLTVPSNTTITGATWTNNTSHAFNLVTVTANGSNFSNTFTVFDVTGTGVAINSLTITGGFPIWNNGNPFPGGGIVNSGTLTLTNSEVTGNGSIVSGGGIYNTGTLTVIGCTIDNNQAAYNDLGNGGGIDNENNGTLNVVNSTIANNSTRNGYGGGIAVESGTATITNSTISSNSVGGGGGGIYNPGGTVNIANSIVSGNSDILTDIKGSYTDKGGNIVASLNGNSINNPNNLNLASLGDYGGYTPTMLPLPGSQAICAGKIANSPNQWQPQSIQIDTDQRGFLNYTESYQPYGGPALCVDAGAVQTSYTIIQISQSSYTASAGGAVTPTVLVAVGENGQNRGGIPITLSYSGPGNLSGNTATTVEYAGATFPNLSVDTGGHGTLSATIQITPCVTECSFVQFSASANLTVEAPVSISPGSETLYASQGAAFSQDFNVSGGGGSYQLSSSGTLPTGLTLTPPGTGSGSSWLLSGTPTAAGTFNFTLNATDAGNNTLTASQSYTLNVAPASMITLSAAPASTASFGQSVTLTATVTPPSATGTVTFYDGSNALGSGPVGLSGGSPNTATLDLNASTLGASLAIGTHSFTAQYSGDTDDTPSTSDVLTYQVTPPNFIVNTTNDDNGGYSCAALASTTSNTTDGNNGGQPGLCTLRDAVNSAASAGSGTIYFDTTIFAASNLAGNPAANTISADTADFQSINLSSNTTIQGLTSGSGAALTNLVTVDGGGASNPNSVTIFVVGGSGNAINNLNINNGYAANGGSGGAITNFGSITVSGSSFNGNQATGSGGAIFNINSLTVLNSTFATNSATDGNGGAIDNSNYSGCAVATIVNSTFYQNSATFNEFGFGDGFAVGGALNNDGGGCTLTVNNSTVFGNSTDNLYQNSGGGIFNGSTLNLNNTIMSGNLNGNSNGDDVADYGNGGNFFDGANIIGGNLIGTYDGTPENGGGVTLSPLGNYGGPTQTMVPEPASAAICAGLKGVAHDQNGNPILTDQRGNAITGGGYCSTGSLDSGAVQTNYSIAFTTQPPASAHIGQTLSPAPVIGLSESGTAFTAGTGTVTMSDSANLLTGTLSEPVTLGAATFGNLTINGSDSNDILTAALPLAPSINVRSTATQGVSTSASAQTITFSPKSGTYTAPQQVTISDSAPGATIYHTTDGTTPTTSSAVFSSSSPISIAQNTTIKALGVESGYKNSSVTMAVYKLEVTTPTFSPKTGTYLTPQSVSISDTASGSTIWYTTDGTAPIPGTSAQYTGTPIAVNQNTTIKAVAAVTGWTNSMVASATYKLEVATPTFSPKAGTYLTPQSVSVSDTASGSTIWYTTDGTTPVPGQGTAVQYTGTPLAMTQDTTIKAVASVTGWSNSAAASATYKLEVATPTFSPKAGTYLTPQSVSITDTAAGSTIWYTTDGTAPVPGQGTAVQYTGTPIAVNQNTTIKAVATVTGWTNSATASAAYKLEVATPTFTPAMGTYFASQSVSISDTAAGSTIWYTTDGTTPVPGQGSAVQFTGTPIAVNQTTTIKAVAAVTGWSNSAAASATYKLEVATPTFSPAAGTHTAAQSVTISDTNSGAQIWYTTDNSTPVVGGGGTTQQYSGPISVTSTKTIKAVAARAGWTNSSMGSATYTIK